MGLFKTSHFWFGAAPATGMPPAPPAEEDPWLTEMKAADAAQAAGD
ncbi:hypothetical protein [Sutterella wadsworthensis]|nr:hypothetical protein [Sutterella wadsworthensis]